MKTKARNPKSLSIWIWLSYLKTALVPLVLVEVIVVAVYFISNSWVKNEMSDYITGEVDMQMLENANIGSSIIQHQLFDIASNTTLFANQIEDALDNEAVMSQEDADRLTYSPEGAYYTAEDNGGAAVYYSGAEAYGEAGRNKVAGILDKQSLMADFCETNPLISSVFFNSYDFMSIIYPYVDVMNLYHADDQVTDYSFYYEADRDHNASRGIVWTAAYADPSGKGLMTSCLKPVYKGNILEGVAGISVSIYDMTKLIMQMPVPYGGYSMLIGSDGTVLRLPEAGRKDWGLSEDTYGLSQPDSASPYGLNINDKAELSELTTAVMTEPTGLKKLALNHDKKVVSWSTVYVNGWKLITIVPEGNIYGKVGQVGSNLTKIGITMIRVLIILFILFIHILYIRSRKMSRNLSHPLLKLNELVHSIGQGQYYQKASDYEVKEFQDTSENLVSMGRSLGDINAHLLATQTELKEKEAYLQALINSVDDIIIVINADGEFCNIIASDPLTVAKNYSGSSTTMNDIMDAQTVDYVMSVVKRVSATGESESVEYRIETMKGLRWFHARITKIEGDMDRLVVSARDITERKELEETISKARDEAEAASRAKTQFLSNMSHELRTPLNAVLGFAQVLEMDPNAPLTGIQKECVYEIIKAGNHLLDLINEILDLAKIEAGKIRLELEPVNIGTVMEETVTLIIPTANKFGIRIDYSTPYCSSKYIMADKTRIKQVLLNLLSNAVKYNIPDGRVHFYCDEENNKIRFHVVDTGIGISEQDIKIIYKPFQRLRAKESVVEGTGVGLTVAKHLAEMMGGEIHVESKLGFGSHFIVELPATPALVSWDDNTGRSAGKGASFAAGGRVKKILYIEDNVANMKLIERVVKLLPNVEFYSAADAESGIDIALEERPDVILLDINLPGMDGYEAFQILRENKETKSTPIIAVSSYAMRQDINRALEIGFTDYITKPINAEQFIEKLKRYLSSYGASE